MSTLTKFALGKMGILRPKPAVGNSAASIALSQSPKQGGLPLMEALARRHSSRDFARDALPLPLLAGLLWAAYGMNRAWIDRAAIADALGLTHDQQVLLS